MGQVQSIAQSNSMQVVNNVSQISNEKCEMIGSVSGGCIEGAVVKAALEIMEDKKPRIMEFGVSNEDAWEVGLACGGNVKVFVEAIES